MTLEELKFYLQQHVDEITLLEILEISSEDIVKRFEDRIIAKREKLENEI